MKLDFPDGLLYSCHILIGWLCWSQYVLRAPDKPKLTYLVTWAGLPLSGKNIWKMNFFQVGEKSGNFVDGQGNLERTWKVREFENKWLWQAVFRKFICSVQEGKDVHSYEIVKAHLPLDWGLLSEERIFSFGEQILSFKINPQI